MSNNSTTFLRVMALEITQDGAVRRKNVETTRESQLDNTLLQALYPDIHVATVDIPEEQLDDYQRAMVERSLGKKIVYNGIEYVLAGASASAKNGKYYAVDGKYANAIAKRFGHWPEAAMTYFGILVSPCLVCKQFESTRVLVVEDHELGTNDCRGWIRRSLFDRLALPDRHFYQFRMSFAGTQAKGSFKVMENDVAEALKADVIIPHSSCKPGYNKKDSVRQTGSVVIGIREVSRNLEFSSSYTLVEHAPMSSIWNEIKPLAFSMVEKVKKSIEDKDFNELFRLIGASEVIHPDDDSTDSEHTSAEHTVVEAVLKADPTGLWIWHPFINNQLQRMLAKWAFKLCTAGGFKLPAFALADDGYLILHNDKIYSGSDWIPEWTAITSLDSDQMLVVRYPIRTKGDLLPVRQLSGTETLNLLMRDLAKQLCPMDSAAAALAIVHKQLALKGTFTLNARVAELNGGDYDFDWICVVEGCRFPLFVQDRINFQAQENKKTKREKKRSPWWNLPQVAFSAKGNAIGTITDLKTSCLAAGRHDLADLCAIELQKALDQLKWGVQPDQEVIAAIRKEVKTAPWLKLKGVERVSDLPMKLDTAPTDVIGALYETLRGEVANFFSDVLPLEDFRGAISGGVYDREMREGVASISRFYGLHISLLMQKKAQYEKSLAQAQADLDAFPVEQTWGSEENKKHRKQLVHKRNQAQTALNVLKKRQKEEMKNLANTVRKWAIRREDRALDWLTAIWDYTCRPRRQDYKRPSPNGSTNPEKTSSTEASSDSEKPKFTSRGSLAFYAFPQLLVDQIVERTGGRPITVALPKLIDGDVRIDQDGSVYLVEEVPDGAGSTVRRESLILQVPGDGRLISDNGRTKQVPRFAVAAGSAQVRNGKLTFPDTQQRPGVPKPKTKPDNN